MHRIIIACVIVLGIGSCKKSNQYCSVKDPLVELPWLNALMTDTTVYKISKTTYKSQEGFLITVCYNADCSATEAGYKDCSGQTVCTNGSFSSHPCINFGADVTYKEDIYTKK
jgi:hypothetical protein